MIPAVPPEVWGQMSEDTRAGWYREEPTAQAILLHIAAGRAACKLEGCCAADHRVPGRCPRCWKVR